MIWAAISIGLLGGLHCTFMCSPLIAAVLNKKTNAMAFSTYQLGRIVSYLMIGSFLYILGRGFSLLGFQNYLTILLSIILVYFYVLPKNWQFFKSLNKLENKPFKLAQGFFQRFFGRKDLFSRFLIGLLNGLLPCGLVYLAAITASNEATLADSIIFMFLFGLGTIPWIALSLLGIKLANFSFADFFRKAKPILALTIAAFLFLRGLEVQYVHIPLPDLGIEANAINIPICGK